MVDFSQTLREHNLKATPQRLAIANALHLHGHMNIDSLYELMLSKFSSLSLATIYKNINIMMENAFIQEVKIPHAKSVYELTKETHSHLVCENCGRVEDITLDISMLTDTIKQKADFEVHKTDLVISGICNHCKH